MVRLKFKCFNRHKSLHILTNTMSQIVDVLTKSYVIRYIVLHTRRWHIVIQMYANVVESEMGMQNKSNKSFFSLCSYLWTSKTEQIIVWKFPHLFAYAHRQTNCNDIICFRFCTDMMASSKIVKRHLLFKCGMVAWLHRMHITCTAHSAVHTLHIRDGQTNLFVSFYLQMCERERERSKLKQMKLVLFKSVNFIVVFSCFSIFILTK